MLQYDLKQVKKKTNFPDMVSVFYNLNTNIQKENSMFQLSTKTHYGVAALIDLANAHSDTLVRIKDIVDNRQISKSYLEQIFNRLSK